MAFQNIFGQHTIELCFFNQSGKMGITLFGFSDTPLNPHKSGFPGIKLSCRLAVDLFQKLLLPYG